MPIYEYKCSACGLEHEAMQKMSDPELETCPDCGKPELRKLISAVGFRLSGSGWYETDFKSSDKKKNLADSRSKENGSEAKKKTDSTASASSSAKNKSN